DGMDSSEVSITVSPTTLAEEGLAQFDPGSNSDTVPLGSYYRISSSVRYDRDIRLIFSFDSEDVPDGFEPEHIRLYHFRDDTMSWVREGGSIEETGSDSYELTAGVNEFSVFTLVVDRNVSSSGLVSSLRAEPNPFSPNGNDKNDLTSFRFTLANDSDVTIKVFDRVGREIIMLNYNVRMSAGENAVEWDGRDSSGRVVRTGIYMVYFLVKDDSGRTDKKTTTVIVSKNLRE
ncbi:MAG: gliding motility-associated C-terminal domain-containing protein, partial [Candidatus Muiribacteriaceae bacterium]